MKYYIQITAFAPDPADWAKGERQRDELLTEHKIHVERKGDDLGFIVATADIEADSPETAARQLILQIKSAKVIRDQEGALVDATWHDDGGHKHNLPLDPLAASVAWTVGRKGPGTPSGIPGEDNPQRRQYEGGPKFDPKEPW
ncbi:MAG TPA: hypothetical protein VKV57_03285 [bacterium]|nr:hypothetical protein [bacterium]